MRGLLYVDFLSSTPRSAVHLEFATVRAYVSLADPILCHLSPPELERLR